jgi:hypothetical protein
MSSQSYRGCLSFGAGGVIAAISGTSEFKNETKASYSREGMEEEETLVLGRRLTDRKL